MKKREKNKKLQEKELHKSQRIEQAANKQKLDEQWSDLMHSPQKNLSEGALNIFNIKRTRSHWGNKQLWGSKDKGRHKSGHQTPKKSKG